MNGHISETATHRGRIAAWIRKNYPHIAPVRGHNYLIALYGLDSPATR